MKLFVMSFSSVTNLSLCLTLSLVVVAINVEKAKHSNLLRSESMRVAIDAKASTAQKGKPGIQFVPATQTAKSLLAAFKTCADKELTRIGPYRDGGYLIPKTVTGGPIISIGIRGDDPVSHFLSSKFGFKADLYDCFSGPSPCPPGLKGCQVTFHQTCAGPQEEKQGGHQFTTIPSMVNRASANRTTSDNLVMKIDCEGCEWDALDSLDEATLKRFSLVIAEFHWLTRSQDHEKFLRVIRKLRETFDIVHTHGSNCSPLVGLQGTDFQIPRTLEATFVRKDEHAAGCAIEADSDFREDLDAPICKEFAEYKGNAFKLPVEA
eukprot:TRINITY_DN49838_c0_g1_i1.p1 TRINITY_DN49838_c0_g1~~TRINITY_DN49838_c0_g1_i1.p1  ORF type:complete len:321 (+),score=45.69 TRINITY_DN49838_c0_g1_i1:64-1026(+)